MAEQLAERFRISEYFCDSEKMLERMRPDVVHITTPPRSHYTLARQCLNAGCHIYVEKPFTLYAKEADELIALAEQTGLKLTVGHDEQFSHAAVRMRRMVQAGYLGGDPVHIESTWCYELGDSEYAGPLLANKSHWVRQLPGGLLQNLISHGIAKIVEFLSTDPHQVTAIGFASHFLRKVGGPDLVDELRVMITEQTGLTAYFTFSSQMRPALHEFRIYGPRGGLVLNEDQQTLVRISGARYKSYLEMFVGPLVLARDYVFSSFRNIGLFLRRDFHTDSSKKNLFESFYKAVVTGGPVPIPYKQISLTSRIMENIFAQLKPEAIRGTKRVVSHELALRA